MQIKLPTSFVTLSTYTVKKRNYKIRYLLNRYRLGVEIFVLIRCLLTFQNVVLVLERGDIEFLVEDELGVLGTDLKSFA